MTYLSTGIPISEDDGRDTTVHRAQGEHMFEGMVCQFRRQIFRRPSFIQTFQGDNGAIPPIAMKDIHGFRLTE